MKRGFSLAKSRPGIYINTGKLVFSEQVQAGKEPKEDFLAALEYAFGAWVKALSARRSQRPTLDSAAPGIYDVVVDGKPLHRVFLSTTGVWYWMWTMAEPVTQATPADVPELLSRGCVKLFPVAGGVL